ncbi:MAG: LamG-like jellyroll fold domain-containing protein [Candidatus Poribacteria bacterium]
MLTINWILKGAPIEASGAGDLWMGGANCCGLGEQFNGRIDDVAIFNRALSEKEVPEAGEIVKILPVQLKGKLTATWASVR